MNDLRPMIAADDMIYQQIVLAANPACQRWAIVRADPQLDMLLYPRDRGPVKNQQPYRVDQRVVEKGIWRVTLCPETSLPAGVERATRDALVQAQIAGTVTGVPFRAMDQVIQCGLFGEVLY
jgi:hypothetical protein